MITTEYWRKPLSEWIHSFGTLFSQQLLFGGHNNSAAAVSVLPDDYLIPALRIASSLADQICKAEEAGQSPTPSSNWMDSIVVHLQSNDYSEDGRFDGKAAEEDDADGEGENNIRVEILPSLLTDNNNNSSRHAAAGGALYPLGIVFFEIFSRGERPAELKKQQQEGGEQQHVGDGTNGSEELSEGFNLFEEKGRTIDQGGTIDLEGELSIFDNLLSDYILSDDDSVSYDDLSFQGHGLRKKRTQNDNRNMCSVSVEPLKAKGLPRALCDLIGNLLNCANEAISNDETYQNMVEVRDDLRLMLNKPLIYLHDQDMGSLSTTGLQFGGAMFGRKAELSTIIDAYHRSLSGECENEVVTIWGQSGTGKSLLAFEFGKYVVSSGGIFIFGKFDQLRQGTPFSALASAFDQYCGMMMQNCELREKLSHQVNNVLGRDAYHLAKLIPNLARILGLDMMNPINHDDDCINAQRRLQYLLRQLVEVISVTFAAPVILFLDDLQWADSSSIAAVNHLLLTKGFNSYNTRFFFIGCNREGKCNSTHLWTTMCKSGLLHAKLTNIQLECMVGDTLNTMVSETLCLSPRLTRTLSSIIYRKTKGNPLFVSRLMLSFNKDGLLRPSLSRGRWEWDEEKILSQKLPDDVAEFLTHSIEKLPEDVKSSLCILSCFGATSSITLIEMLERALGNNLVDSLDVAVSEGLLDKEDDQYRFSHDRIQKAAYDIMNVLDRCKFHFSYGMALATLCVGEQEDSILLTAVNQLNMAGPEAVQHESQSAIVANLNLRAGKKAMAMSDFEAAYSNFDHGISFLRKKHWKEHYTLSLELFNLAAKCALTNGDIDGLNLLSQQVLRMTQPFEDKLDVLYCTMCALAVSSKLPESIEKGLDILSKLGIELRGCESRGMAACVQETTDLLSAFTDDEILNTRRMTDTTMIMAMKFLGKLETGMTQIMPETAPYVAQRIIQLSVDHGMSPVSPIGFVHFGSYMAKLGDIRGGYKYVKLALSLLDKVGSRESAGEVICFGTQVRAYVEPLQASIDYHNEGYAAAMSSGDIIQAAVNIMFFGHNSFRAGLNLQTVQKRYAQATRFMEERKLVIFKVQSQYVQDPVFKLIGTDEQPKYVSAEEQTILATNNSVRTSYFFARAYVSFVYRSYDDTKENVEKYLCCIRDTWANLFLSHAFQAFYVGLISFWLARKSRDEHRWHERGSQSKLALRRWAESSQWTFENKLYLLEAEESFCNNDFEAAKAYYEKAISSAKIHKFVHEEALAYELAAYLYLELGEINKSVEYFLLAHERYHEWGAIGKCTSLFEFVEGVMKEQVGLVQSAAITHGIDASSGPASSLS